MKNKSTNGDKREVQLKYRYQELKKMGKIKKDTTLNQFRNSEFNKAVIKDIVIVTKKGKNITRKVKKWVTLKALTEAKDFTFPAEKAPKRIVVKSERREARRHLKHVILKMIQEAAALRKEQKKLNRQLRIDNANEKIQTRARKALVELELRAAA